MAATIKDVSRMTGLSIATVSKYINGFTLKEKNRALIEAAIRELDFRPNEIARGLKTSRSMTVGVLIPSLENIFATSIVSVIETALLARGYSMILCDYRQDPRLEREKFEFLLGKSVDGIIAMPLGLTGEAIAKAAARNAQVVFIDRVLQGVDCDAVLVDNLNASYQAVERFIRLGHRRIAIIGGPQNIHTAQERLKGYMRVHEDWRIPVDESLVRIGDYEIQSGYDVMEALLDMPNPPTAVLVTNYEMTLGAVMCLNERNVRVPEQISVIGHDNLQLARVFRPRLEMVIQPIREIGETAARVLMERLHGDAPQEPAVYRLKTELVEGNSILDLSRRT